MVHPIVLGSGTGTFDEEMALRLAGTKSFSSGSVVPTYEPESGDGQAAQAQRV